MNCALTAAGLISLSLVGGFAAAPACAPVSGAPAAGPEPAAVKALTEREKIDRMLDHLAASEAVFIRNGSEHTGAAAAAHLRTKLGAAGSAVKTAKDFIRLLATKSSVTGKAYHVRPKTGAEVESSAWFTALLATIEAESAVTPKG